MCGSMADIQSPKAEIKRGKKEERKKEERKKKPQDENIMVCPIPSGDHKETTAQKYNGLPYYIGQP